MQTSKSRADVHDAAHPGVSGLIINASEVLSAIQHPTDGIICEGWLLKKRRKKMQGTYIRSRPLIHGIKC